MKEKLSVIASLLLLLLFAETRVLAQWAHVTGTQGTVISCFAVSGTNLFAGSLHGVLLSTDDGINWIEINSGLINREVNCLVLSGGDLYIGTSKSGVFRSTNNGSTWNGFGLSDNTFVYALIASGNYLFAGTSSTIYRSPVGDSTWTEVGIIQSQVNIFAASNSNLFAGTDRGVLLSANNGAVWNAANNGLVPDTNIAALIVSGTKLFAGAWGGLLPAYSGVFISSDNAISWKANGLVGSNITSLAGIGVNLFAGSFRGVFLSTNDGSSWVNTGLTDTLVTALAIIGNNLYAGTGSGIWRRPLAELIGGNGIENLSKMEPSIESFPNPFSQSTSIKFSSSDHAFTQVSIHNLLGSEVARLFSGSLDAGEHSFTWDAHGMPPGMYICIVRANGLTEELPVMLVK